MAAVLERWRNWCDVRSSKREREGVGRASR